MEDLLVAVQRLCSSSIKFDIHLVYIMVFDIGLKIQILHSELNYIFVSNDT